jgi:hypothetical protein
MANCLNGTHSDIVYIKKIVIKLFVFPSNYALNYKGINGGATNLGGPELSDRLQLIPERRNK